MKNWLTKRNAILTIIAVVTFTVMLGFWASKVQFSYEFERFFPANDPEIKFYQNYKDQFLFSDTRTVVAIELPSGLLNQKTLRKLKNATDSLQKLTLVQNVFSVPQLKYFIESPMGFLSFNMIDIEHPENYKEDSLRITRSENVLGSFIDSTFTSVTLQVYTGFYLTKTETDSMVVQVAGTLNYFGFDQLYFGGRLINKTHILDKMKYEMGLFVSISLVLVLIALFIVFRSFWGVVVPIIVVLFSAVWVIGFMSLFGKEIDLLSSLIPSILTIVGISDVIHIYTKYIAELRKGQAKEESIFQAYKQVGLATFITSVTTSVGFLSLLVSSIMPMVEFGVFMALGVMIAFVLSFSLFPAALVLLPKPNIALKNNNHVWDDFLTARFNWVLRAKKQIAVVAVLLFALSIYSVSQLKVNNYITEELPRGDELRNSFEFFEEHFTGMRTFDLALVVTNPDLEIFDYEIIEQINTLDNYLKEEYEVGSIISPAVIIKQCNQAHFGGDFSKYSIPEKGNYDGLRKILKQLKKNKHLAAVVNKDQKNAKISGNIIDEGGYIHLKKNAALLSFAKENCPDLELHLTGMMHLIDVNNLITTHSLLKSLGLAFLLVGIIMAFLYKSVKLVFIAIIPNVLPLLLVGMVMYLAGIDLKVSTALIFTVSFGIAVDDTIHFLGNLKMELSQGKLLHNALKHTFKTTGKSIILTSIILFVGFVSLSLSEFSSSYYFGLLVSLSLLFAVIIDLTLLPVLLLWLPNKKGKA